jgi:L-fuconolactonase
VIDAHQHFWQRSGPFDYHWLDEPLLAPINRDFLPDDLAPLLRAAGVDASVIVQTQHDTRENHWALGLADKYSFIAGVVGWVDLASPDCEAQLDGVIGRPKFVGVRHVTHRTTISSSGRTCRAGSACSKGGGCRSTSSSTSDSSDTRPRSPARCPA